MGKRKLKKIAHALKTLFELRKKFLILILISLSHGLTYVKYLLNIVAKEKS